MTLHLSPGRPSRSSPPIPIPRTPLAAAEELAHARDWLRELDSSPHLTGDERHALRSAASAMLRARRYLVREAAGAPNGGTAPVDLEATPSQAHGRAAANGKGVA